MHFFNFHHHFKNQYGIYNLSLNEDLPNTPFSIGIHPQDINEEWQKNLEWLQTGSLEKQCIAIGECGLDRMVSTTLPLQEEVFKEHLIWANKIKKPVIIHCVRTYSEIIKFKKWAETPLIIHGFNKNANLCTELLHHGFYISFGKASLQNVYLQEIIKKFPLERLFLETDASHFDISLLYEKVANIKGISIDKLTKQIQENLDFITSL